MCFNQQQPTSYNMNICLLLAWIRQNFLRKEEHKTFIQIAAIVNYAHVALCTMNIVRW